jgi:hypothetical protein
LGQIDGLSAETPANWYCNCKISSSQKRATNPEVAMRIELHCPDCSCHFGAAPEAPATEILDQMIEEGTWYALGDGETFEDMIFAALTSRGLIRCPECGEAVSVSEESLGQLSQEMLRQR